MSDLTEVLKAHIARAGPITVAEYMHQCLYHPTLGYYTTADPVGGQGDFITAPEVSQMFGELLGLALAQSWLDQGAPASFCLCELGPGSGQLMSDVLRATRSVPGFHDALELFLCELNPKLKERQKATLAEFSPNWVEKIEDLPARPLWLLANEFFDCLPIRQFIKTEEGWQEKMVAVKDDVLVFARGPIGQLADELPADFPAGTTLELRPSANAIMEDIAKQIADHGGCALVFDYGSAGETGDTLQSLKHHEKVPPFAYPGSSDLTAHVDFAALAIAAAQHAQVTGITDQGVFLERLGITGRAQHLASHLRDEALEIHIAAHRRLTHPEEMGKLFKVLAITPKSAPPPPGYTE